MARKQTVDVPESRFQEGQDQTTVESTKETQTGQSSYDVKTTKAGGSQLKQEIAATVIANGKGASLGSNGDVASVSMPSAYQAGSYSGDSAGYLGSAGGTPIADKPYQGDSRVDKKLSDPNKQINTRASEQYATEQIHSPFLRENKSTVGPNGNPSSVAARAQKKTGIVPADPMFDRSVDEVRQDFFVFLEGQQVEEKGISNRAYPTKTMKQNANGTWVVDKKKVGDKEVDNDPVFVLGNYSPRYIIAKYKKEANGAPFLSSFEVEESNFSCSEESYDVVNVSATNTRANLNKAEIDRQAIDAKYGNPDSNDYSPLGRSVDQPTQTVTLLRSMEAVTGGIVASALRFAQKSKSYFLARTGKDGIEEKSPGIDALYGHLFPYADAAAQKAINIKNADEPFMSPEGCRRGSAAILISAFDSPRKFKTKGDLVNQPRGLKLALQTGLNNHMPLRARKEFLAAVNGIDVFSTIDRGYDPSSVTCVTDGVRYILPYSWKAALKFTRASAGASRDYTNGSRLQTYKYQAGDGNQTYIIKLGEPVLNGIAWFLEQYAPGIYSAISGKASEGEFTLKIPVVSHGCYFSLFDYLIAASAAYIEYERTNTMKDVLDLEARGGYPFDDLVPARDFITATKNYGGLDQYKELSAGLMNDATRLLWTMPEVFSPIRIKEGETFILPYYFNQRDYVVQKKSATMGTFIKNDKHGHSVPIIRSGVRLAYLDDFYAMEALDNLLVSDRMTRIPFHDKKQNFDGLVYKYGGYTDGQIVITSADASAITYKDVHSTPRLLGWYFTALAGDCRCVKNFGDGETIAPDSTKVIDGGSSFVARLYKGLPQTGDALANKVLGINQQNIERGRMFAQTWYDYSACYGGIKSSGFDVLLASSASFDKDWIAQTDKVRFAPFCYSEYTEVDPDEGTLVGPVAVTEFSLFSSMRYMWTRIQKLPFVINPFDNMEDDDSQYVDPYDFAYMLGLCGFLSANYDEELDNRIADFQNAQFSYVNDPMTMKNPLLK